MHKAPAGHNLNKLSTINHSFYRHKSTIKSRRSFQINHNIFLNPRYYRTFALGSFAFLLTFLASAILTPVSPSSAQVLQYDVDVTGDYYVQVSGSDVLSLASLKSTPTGQLASLRDTINVETNSPTGYKLLFSTDSANLVNTTDNNAYFTPTTGTIESPTPLGVNTWGFAFNKTNTGVVDNSFTDPTKYYSDSTISVPDPSSTWAAVPTAPTQISALDSPNVSTDGTDLDIYYGVNATTTLTAGTYTTTITYTALAEGINTFPNMQNFTQEMCNNMQVSTADSDHRKTLTDSRDGKRYNIAKLADGNCWMVSNLALDPIDSNGNNRTLTTKDTNINLSEIASGTYTFPDNVLITSGATSAANREQIYNADATKTTTSCGTYAYCDPDNTEPYGNYYNYMSATLGVGTTSITSGKVYSSVCPKGWRLPDSGTSEAYGASAPDKSYGKLMYSVLGFNSENATSTTGGAYAKAAQQAPLHFPLSGAYGTSSSGDHGVNGNYWSRTVQSNTGSYYLNIYAADGYFYPQGSNGKRYGFSVRCVFGESDITDSMYMQDITQTMCNNLDETTSTTDNRKTLIDSRDNKTYRIAKLADGNCWMVQNLALDGTDSTGKVRELTPADSDVTENRKLAPNATSGTSSTEVKIYSEKATDTATSCSYTYCEASNEPYGNLYNWFAATATTGISAMKNEDAPDSICPKNWKLPTSGSNFAYGANAPDKSYGKLMYSILGFNSENATSTTGGEYVKNAQKAPLYLPLAGYFYTSGYGNQGRFGNYWARSAYASSDNAYSLFFSADNGDFYPQNNHNKTIGSSVRCVFASS